MSDQLVGVEFGMDMAAPGLGPDSEFFDVAHDPEFRRELNGLNEAIATGEPIEGNVCYPNGSTIEWIRQNEPWSDVDVATKRINLRYVARHSDNMLEIGLNGGHSALVLLVSNPSLTLYCVDLCWHAYTLGAIRFLQARFGTRFHVWQGDSREMMPQLFVEHPLLRFDAIHVDGGHSGGIAIADMSNAVRMARPGAYFVVDDFPHPPIADAFGKMLTAGLIQRARDDAKLPRTPLHEIARVA